MTLDVIVGGGGATVEVAETDVSVLSTVANGGATVEVGETDVSVLSTVANGGATVEVGETGVSVLSTVSYVTVQAATVAANPATIGKALVDVSNNINDGTTATRTIAASYLGAGWAVTNDAVTFSGTPTWAQVAVNISFTSSGQRVAPVVELYRNAVLVADSHTGYIRNQSGHSEAGANFVFIDPTPGTNPAYSIRSRRGTNQSAAVYPLSLSNITCVAY